MAQTNYTPISLYYSTTASAVPTAANLVPGELAINTNDGKLYYEDSSGVVQVLATKSTGSIGGSNTQVQFNNSGSLGGSSSFTWDGTTVTATKFAGALNGTVGATTASTGAFTTLSTSSTTTFSGLTASTALALDASKNVVSVTNTGTGNNVLSASPTLTGTIAGASLSLSSLTSGRVTYAGASGLLTDSANLTFNGNTLTSSNGTGANLVLNSTADIPYVAFNHSSASKFLIGASAVVGGGTGYYDFYGAAAIGQRFWTGATERMRITDGGNVGIGTSSPSYNLSVAGNTASEIAVQIINSSIGNTGYRMANSLRSWAMFVNDSDSGALRFYDYTASAERMRIDSSGSLLVGTANAPTTGGFPRSVVLFKQLNDTSAYSGIQLEANGNTNVLGIGYNGSTFNFAQSYRTTGGFIPISFSTSNAEAMRIDTSGNLLVGTSSLASSEKLNVTGTSAGFLQWTQNSNASPYGAIVYFSAAAPNNATNVFVKGQDNAAVRFELRSNGGLANFSANNANLSDERTKKDIQNSGNYLDKICAIPVRTFKYKDQTDNELNLGVIAQEVEKVAPELIDNSGFGETPDDGIPLKAIYQTDLQYALMKCIQEQQALIESLTTRLTALENK